MRCKLSTIRAAAGLTLIEMLFCISLVVILGTLLFSALERSRTSAYSSIDASNLRQLAIASIAYASDNGTLPPTYGTILPSGQRVDNTAWWLELYPNYVESHTVFTSPMDDTGYSPESTGSWTRDGIRYPEAKVSYGAIGHNSGNSDFKPNGKALGSLADTSKTALYTNFQHSNKRLSKSWYGQHPRWTSEITYVYGNGTQAHVVFVDGHVDLMSNQQMREAIASKTLFFGTENN